VIAQMAGALAAWSVAKQLLPSVARDEA
jgi:hypothetical protein